MPQITPDSPPPDKLDHNSQQPNFPMDRKNKIHKSSSSSSAAADLTPATRNSFAHYALAKSAAAPPPLDLSDIDGEPDFFLPLPITAAPKLKAPCFTSNSRRLDLTAARREYDENSGSSRTESQKAVLKRAVLSRLKELSEMETKSKVGIEIAEAVDFLKALYSSDSASNEITEISEKSREGVMKLQEGQLLVKKSQDQLRSVLRHQLFSLD
ncbi:hypothetical protein LINGRAHAP2_LOCUS28813 [Linum grandiflorum]